MRLNANYLGTVGSIHSGSAATNRLRSIQQDYTDYADKPASDGAEATRSGAAPASFSSKLHELLAQASEDEDMSKIISWQEHGRSFKILDRETFASTLLPQ